MREEKGYEERVEDDEKMKLSSLIASPEPG
jgi:hypothetical protein